MKTLKKSLLIALVSGVTVAGSAVAAGPTFSSFNATEFCANATLQRSDKNLCATIRAVELELEQKGNKLDQASEDMKKLKNELNVARAKEILSKGKPANASKQCQKDLEKYLETLPTKISFVQANDNPNIYTKKLKQDVVANVILDNGVVEFFVQDERISAMVINSAHEEFQIANTQGLKVTEAFEVGDSLYIITLVTPLDTQEQLQDLIDNKNSKIEARVHEFDLSGQFCDHLPVSKSQAKGAVKKYNAKNSTEKKRKEKIEKFVTEYFA